MERFNHDVGWPENTPDEEAIPGTLQSARAHCEGLGWVMEEQDPEPELTKVQTPAHAEAGEFLVCLWGSRYRPGEEV